MRLALVSDVFIRVGGMSVPSSAWERGGAGAHAEPHPFLTDLLEPVFLSPTRSTLRVGAGEMPGRGPMNAFAHIREFPDVEFKVVVRPNFDTLYSSAFLDVTAEPVIVSAPETNGRCYMLPMLDMWTDVSPCPESAPAVPAPAIGRSCPRDGTATFHREWSGLTHPRRTCGSSAARRRIGQPTMNGFMPSKTVIRIYRSSWWGTTSAPLQSKFDQSVDMVTSPLDQSMQCRARSFFPGCRAYGDLYAKRVVVAMLRLGADPPEDVIYPLVMADVDGGPGG